jgi:hypothetical protein
LIYPHTPADEEAGSNSDLDFPPAVEPHSPTALAEITPDDFQVALDEQRAKREMLESYIRTQLIDEVDYGKIGDFGKPTLLKPGAEKIAAVLRLRPHFAQDQESRDMLGQEGEGVVCFICRLVTPDGVLAGEGRGACGPEPSRSGQVKPPNTRIKIAMKRAQVDAVLRVAALSERFTQDLEDMPDQTAGSGSYPQPPAPPSPTPLPPKPAEWSPQRSRSEVVQAVHAQEEADRFPPPTPAQVAAGPMKPIGNPHVNVAREHPATVQAEVDVSKAPHIGFPQIPNEPWQSRSRSEARLMLRREGREYPAQGMFRWGPNDYPTVGGRDTKRNFFAPSDRESAGFTREEPWVTWNTLTWRGLLEYAVHHRIKHTVEQEETNRFNDPIKAILADGFWPIYNHKATWIAEMAVAVDDLADAYVAQHLNA